MISLPSQLGRSIEKVLSNIDLNEYAPARSQQLLEELARLDFKSFNVRIGLPAHVKTGLPTQLAPFHLAYFETIEKMSPRFHKFHLNKSRQSGWSEIHLRIFAYRGFHKYAGKQCRIIAGTRGALAEKLITRLRNCFANIPEVVENNSDSMYLELKNGTVYEGLPANPEASTGDTQISAWLLDESAKWDLKDDQPVMNSILPLVRSNRADLFMISTPKGPRGFFYDIDMDRQNEDEWFKTKSNIWETEGFLYTHEEIQKMLNDPRIDAAQEYLNQYTVGRNSIFGTDFPSTDSEAWEL